MLSAFENFSSPDIRIWPEESDGIPNHFAWASPHLDDASSAQELADRSVALKAIFDGAMLLTHGVQYHSRPLSRLECDDGNIIRNFIFNGEPDVMAEPFSASQISAKCNSLRDPMGSLASYLIFLARYDDIAKNLLKFLGVQGLNYMSLYGLIDWVKQDNNWNKKRIAAAAGLSNSRYDDFTGTANNPAYLGPFCRHGGISGMPSRPMPFSAAETPIRKAVAEFLKERGRIIKLDEKWASISTP